jgi:ABC-2 type transport system permease protein
VTNLLLAEALKLRTTRTMWALLCATVAVSALAVASAVIVGSDTNLDLESARGAREIMNVTANGAIFVLVLGVIVSAGEFRMGTATDTFLTTPRRWRVVAAKLVTAAVVGLVFGALAAGVSIGIAGLSYRLEGLTFPLGSSDAWSTLGGSVLYAALFGAIGAATGSLVRNQVVAIVGWLVWIAVVEHIATGFAPDIGRWLPVAAGRALVGETGQDLLSRGAAAIVLASYALVIMGMAIVSERYRDA